MDSQSSEQAGKSLYEAGSEVLKALICLTQDQRALDAIRAKLPGRMLKAFKEIEKHNQFVEKVKGGGKGWGHNKIAR